MLSEVEMDANGALRLAKGMEAAEEHTKKLQELSTTADSKKDVSEEPVTLNSIKKSFARSTSGQSRWCNRCKGRGHTSDQSFRSVRRFKCHRTGHIARACPSLTPAGKRSWRDPHFVELPCSESDQLDGAGDVYRTGHVRAIDGDCRRLWIRIKVNKVPLKMELDTGAGVTLVSERVWREVLQSPPLKRS